MDGSPKLITDVQFDQRKRGGYDPDQVDNFLAQLADRVAQLQDMLRRATAQVEEAESRAAEAQRAQSVAEAQIDKLKSDLAREQVAASQLAEATARQEMDAETEAEHASRVLVMAQKTADATIEDANRTAQHTVSEARAKAADLVGAAEGDAERLRSEARRETEALIAKQRDAVMAEVHDLEQLRDKVAADVETLQTFLDGHRERVRHGIAELQRLLDDPASFRAEPTPPLSGASAADVVPKVESPPEPVYEPEPVPVPEASDEGEQGDEAAASAEPAGAEASTPDADAPADDVAVVTEGDGAEFPEVPVPEILRDENEASAGGEGIDLTADRLFEGTVEPDIAPPPRVADDAGPPTELFTPFTDRPSTEGDDPLGPPDAEADEAMRAFFEADFEEGEEEEERHKPRFGFRR